MAPIGVMVNNLEGDRLAAFAVAAAHGFGVVHTSALPESCLQGPQRQAYVRAARSSQLTIASMFVGFDGQSYADMPTIRRTVGLVIPELREHRCRVAKQYISLAKELGVPSLSAHIGFIPDRSVADYSRLVECVQDIVEECTAAGQTFHLETGQDAADVFLEFICDVGRSALGVNFDPANFLLYGTDDPLRALDELAPLVKGVHCKDAVRSQEPGALGTEVPLGQGEVDFPALLQKLRDHGYRGPLIIEREAGANVVADILAGREYLQGLLQAC